MPWPIDSKWHWPERFQFSIWNEKNLGRGEKIARCKRMQRSQWKKNVKREDKIDAVTHHENHEPWLQVGAPNVSQRFQPPWWSPGWCPFPLCRSRLSFFAHDCHGENSRSLFFLFRLKFGDTNKRVTEIIVVEKSAINERYAILLLLTQACGKIRIHTFAFLVTI